MKNLNRGKHIINIINQIRWKNRFPHLDRSLKKFNENIDVCHGQYFICQKHTFFINEFSQNYHRNNATKITYHFYLISNVSTTK